MPPLSETHFSTSRERGSALSAAGWLISRRGFGLPARARRRLLPPTAPTADSGKDLVLYTGPSGVDAGRKAAPGERRACDR